ncbi:helix-turn-helix domain-containing protein [Polynucleobacter sp. Nonnen-W13]|uniref:helix-turn-helix domain-containing protein n=1 Tax=Polynucleobacter sp. Nonnen-W13 TaxID=1855625 RepID=UPI001C0D60AE|nr:helix-turn-helix transcriptional regulator [Polynucleobacter sp. Nonnen-W13]
MQPSLSIRFGQVIRTLRNEAGMSQVVFAERCGFYQTYLSRIETGQANPSLNAIEVISNSLGITVFELFERIREHSRKRS